MPISVTSVSTSTGIIANSGFFYWVVTEGTYVTVSTGDAIDATSSDTHRTFVIDGHVIAEGYDAIDSGNAGGGGFTSIIVGESGSLLGGAQAIESSYGNLSVTNDGMIVSGAFEAVLADGDANSIINRGTITSSSYSAGAYDAIRFIDAINSVTNEGLISGARSGITSEGATLMVANSGSIVGRGGNGIEAETEDHSILNSGTIQGAVSGIRVGPGALIENSGHIIGNEESGIFAISGGLGGANLTATNDGTITAETFGIYVQEGHGHITNNGTITSNDGTGIFVGQFENVTSSNFVLNTGVITAAQIGIRSQGEGDLLVNEGSVFSRVAVQMELLDGALTDFNTLINTGSLTGSVYAILGSVGSERITNSGYINGDVSLGFGNDIFHGELGFLNDDAEIFLGGGNDELYGGEGRERVYDGSGDDTVVGNGGNDSFRAGSGANFYDGGDGFDYLSYYDFSTFVRIDLESGSTSGGGAGNAASNDSFINIEAIGGTNVGGDTLLGSSERNTLYGWGGR